MSRALVMAAERLAFITVFDISRTMASRRLESTAMSMGSKPAARLRAWGAGLAAGRRAVVFLEAMTVTCLAREREGRGPAGRGHTPVRSGPQTVRAASSPG